MRDRKWKHTSCHFTCIEPRTLCTKKENEFFQHIFFFLIYFIIVWLYVYIVSHFAHQWQLADFGAYVLSCIYILIWIQITSYFPQSYTILNELCFCMFLKINYRSYVYWNTIVRFHMFIRWMLKVLQTRDKKSYKKCLRKL